LLTLAALYAASRWFSAVDELEGRPYWLVAWASLAVASALNGVPQSSIPWGMALILPGSLLFLYYPRIQRINFLLLLGLIGLSGLPFTPAASGWAGLVGNGFTVWTFLLIVAHGFMVLGYLEQALKPGGEPGALESWARLVYPLGLILIIQSMVALGLVGWPGALTLGVWWLALMSNTLIVAILLLIRRFGVSAPYFQLPSSSKLRIVSDYVLPRIEPIFRLDWLYRVAWQLFYFLGKILKLFSSILEGEGGILWTALILVLLIALFSGTGVN